MGPKTIFDAFIWGQWWLEYVPSKLQGNKAVILSSNFKNAESGTFIIIMSERAKRASALEEFIFPTVPENNLWACQKNIDITLLLVKTSDAKMKVPKYKNIVLKYEFCLDLLPRCLRNIFAYKYISSFPNTFACTFRII